MDLLAPILYDFRMWQWAISSTGQAAATWLSAVFSVIAIVIALVVALVEQRRAHAEQKRELEQERLAQEVRDKAAADAKKRFIDVCLVMVDEAVGVLQGEIARMQPFSDSYVGWRPEDGVPYLINPILSSLRALQSVWQDDPQLVLTLSRTVRTMHELVEPTTIDRAPPGAAAIRYATARLADLQQRHGEFVACAPR